MRVLVAEDESRLAAALERGLSHAGFVVDTTGDGAAALELATERAYDVIVLDIMLPTLSGYEVTRRLRAQGIWTPILIALGPRTPTNTSITSNQFSRNPDHRPSPHQTW